MLPVWLACLATVFTGKPADVGGWVRATSGRREARGDSLWDPQGAYGGVGFQQVFYCRAREEPGGLDLLWEQRLEKV